MLYVFPHDSLVTSPLSFFFPTPSSRPLLPSTLPLFSKVKVRDLEQKCRSQSEHYHQLSKELLNFHLQSDPVDILKINPTSTSQILLSREKKLSQVIVGFETKAKTGGSVVSAHNTLQVSFDPLKRNGYIFNFFLNILQFTIKIVDIIAVLLVVVAVVCIELLNS